MRLEVRSDPHKTGSASIDVHRGRRAQGPFNDLFELKSMILPPARMGQALREHGPPGKGCPAAPPCSAPRAPAAAALRQLLVPPRPHRRSGERACVRTPRPLQRLLTSARTRQAPRYVARTLQGPRTLPTEDGFLRTGWHRTVLGRQDDTWRPSATPRDMITMRLVMRRSPVRLRQGARTEPQVRWSLTWGFLLLGAGCVTRLGRREVACVSGEGAALLLGSLPLALLVALDWAFVLSCAFLAALAALWAASSASVFRWSGASLAVASAAFLPTWGLLNGHVGREAV